MDSRSLLHRRCLELVDWNRRFFVTDSIAEGIEHLHGLESPVIHGDIKPSNILLDSIFSAKIADFGLARLKQEQVEINFGLVDQSPENVVKVPGSPDTTTVVYVSPELGEKTDEEVVTRKIESRDWWWKQNQDSDVEKGKVKEYVRDNGAAKIEDYELCAVRDAFETMMSQGLSDYQKKLQLKKLMNLGTGKRKELSGEWKALCIEEGRLYIKKLRFSTKLAKVAFDR